MGSWITSRRRMGRERNTGSRRSACSWFSQVQRMVTFAYPSPQSAGKVDMVVALINATYLVEQDMLFGFDGVIVQT